MQSENLNSIGSSMNASPCHSYQHKVMLYRLAEWVAVTLVPHCGLTPGAQWRLGPLAAISHAPASNALRPIRDSPELVTARVGYMRCPGAPKKPAIPTLGEDPAIVTHMLTRAHRPGTPQGDHTFVLLLLYLFRVICYNAASQCKTCFHLFPSGFSPCRGLILRAAVLHPGLGAGAEPAHSQHLRHLQ